MGHHAGLVMSSMEPEWLGSYLGNCIIGGMGTILILVPHIFIILFLLSIHKDCRYLARAVFAMDRLMYSIGIPGKSFITMLIGFGCNVPNIMATRTIKDP
ncbi:MAG: nucleoside recognition domain-containing protein [Methanomicrobiales archaeon]